MEKPLLTLPLLLLLAGCRGPTTQHTTGPDAEPKCGDGLINPGEQCEGSDLDGASCATLGFDQGQLTCSDTCQFVTTACTKKCGNGVLDLGEACDGTLGLSTCATFGVLACTDTCELDTRHCISPGLEVGPTLDLVEGGPTALADLTPKGPGDLLVAVPSFSRAEVYPWVAPQGFDATSSRKLALEGTPRWAEALDVDLDGVLDVAALLEDGRVNLSVAAGGAYVSKTFDAGITCPTTRVAGRGNFGRGDAGRDLLLAGCGQVRVLGASPSAPRGVDDGGLVVSADFTGDGLSEVAIVAGDGTSLDVLPGPGADGGLTFGFPHPVRELALGDLDGDGDLDGVALTDTGLEVLENTGAAFAARQTLADTATAFLSLGDVDLDGRLDAVYVTATELVVRRGVGNWTFTEHRLTAFAGPALTVSLGDADGDGDLDVAITTRTTGRSTRTVLVRNRVR